MNFSNSKCTVNKHNIPFTVVCLVDSALKIQLLTRPFAFPIDL